MSATSGWGKVMPVPMNEEFERATELSGLATRWCLNPKSKIQNGKGS